MEVEGLEGGHGVVAHANGPGAGHAVLKALGDGRGGGVKRGERGPVGGAQVGGRRRRQETGLWGGVRSV